MTDPVGQSQRLGGNPRWWNRWTISVLIVVGVLGMLLLAWDVAQILLEVRGMR